MNVFKVFFGDLDGSELPVNNNEDISVGNDVNCDIYLATDQKDSSSFIINLVDDEHVIFKLGKEQLSQFNGEIIESDTSYTLPLFFSLANLKLAIGQASQLLTYPETVDAELEITEEVNSDGLDLLNEGDIEDSQQLAPVPPTPLQLAYYQHKWQQLAAKFAPLTAYLNQKYQWMAIAVYSAIALLIVFSIFGVVIYLKISYQQEQAAKLIAMEIELKKTYNQLATSYFNLTLRKNRNQKQYLLQGLLVDTKENNLIHSKLDKFNKILQYNLVPLAAVLNKIKTILNDHDMSDVQVMYDATKQTVNLTGVVVYDNNVIDDTAIDLNNQLLNIATLNFAIYSQDQLTNEFNTAIGDLSKLVTIKYSLTKGILNINVSGYLDAKQLANYTDIAGQFSLKYPQAIHLTSHIEDAVSALPFGIYGIFVGNPSYLINDKGDTIFVGGNIGKFKLVAITANTITLANAGYNFDIPLSQLGGSQVPAVISDASSRADILQEELAKTNLALADEKKQVVELTKYKSQVMAESSLNFVEQQLNNLNDDIQVKQKEQANLEELLHVK